MSSKEIPNTPSSGDYRTTQIRAAYVAPRIEKMQKLAEVTGQQVSGVIVPPQQPS